MPAYFETGFSVAQLPWHGLGELIPEDKKLSIEEGLIAAGLDWDVQLRPLCIAEMAASPDPDQIGPLPEDPLAGMEVPANATVRSTDNKVLGVVGMRYHPLQNVDAFQWFQPFLDADVAHLHTAGSLHGGSRVWVLSKLNNDPMEITPGDEVNKFMLLSNSHDGTTSIRVGFTPIRVVCANTLAMAHSDTASALLRVKHSKNVRQNLELVRETMDAANSRFEATAEQFRLLARTNVNSADLDKYIKIVLDCDEKPSTRTKNIIEEIVGRFEQPVGNDGASLAGGTYWTAYNAVTEYLSYSRGRNTESRIASLWYGDSMKVNQRALKSAVELAA